MQYLLTQQEYDELQRAKQQRAKAQTAELQKLCTLAAQHVPVAVSCFGVETLRPWGCILDSDPEKNPGYCDLCPAQDLCPSERKEWSK
jgi:hypothetical protein